MADALVASVAPERPGDPARFPVLRWVSENEAQRAMPRAAVVLLKLHPDGPMAYRYAADGTFAGDTWHESKDAALRALAGEYGDSLSAWQAVPEGADPDDYALSLVRPVG